MAFDIERYKENSKKIELGDIDWARVKDYPVPQGAIDAMTYMMDIETHTVIYLSELLVSKACMDPVITAFLSAWVYEEMYHGEAFVKFFRAYGIPVSDDRPRQVRLKEGLGRVSATMTIMLGSYVLPFFPALYLTVGAVNELTTLTGYSQLKARCNHPILNQILDRVIKQERTHFAFYRSMSEQLLRESATARGVVRYYYQLRPRVVGEGVKNEAEIDQLAAFLFDGEDGLEAARSVDRQVVTLPGLKGFDMLETVRARALGRLGQAGQVTLLPGEANAA
ncbi:MAG: hypothetical protein NVSMB17_08880 [Candidatus Dormibacteria bacterium]